MGNPVTGFLHWRLYADDNADVDSQTPIGNEDSVTEVVTKGSKYHFRFSQYNDNSAAFNGSFQLRARKNGGSWFDVTNVSSDISIADGTPDTSGGDLNCDTQILTSHPTFSWEADGYYEETDGNTPSSAHAKSTFWEDQWCILIGNALSGGDYFEFDITTDDGTRDTPGTFPKITVASGGTTEQVSPSDGIKWGDQVTGEATVLGSISDGWKIGDILSSKAEAKVGLTDGWKFGDILLAINQVSLSDGIKWGEALTVLVGGVADLTDGWKIGEDIDTVTYEQFSGDGIKWGDLVDPRIDFLEYLTDGWKLGDLSEAILLIIESASDGIKWGDTASVSTKYPVSSIDGIKWGDSLSIQIVYETTLTDGIKWGDLAEGQADEGESVSVSDGILWGDSLDVSATVPVSASDGIKWGDLAEADSGAFESISDGILWGDQVVSEANVPVSISDGILWGDRLAFPIAGLIDDFNGPSLDTSLWSKSEGGGATVTYIGGVIEFYITSPDIGTGDLTSVYEYDLRNSSIYVKFDLTDFISSSWGWAMFFLGDLTNGLGVYHGGTTYKTFSKKNGSEANHIITHSRYTYPWWRIRETGGTVYWDCAQDNGGSPGSWENEWTRDVDLCSVLSGLLVNFRIYRGNTQAYNLDFYIDGVNTDANPILTDGIKWGDSVEASFVLSDGIIWGDSLGVKVGFKTEIVDGWILGDLASAGAEYVSLTDGILWGEDIDTITYESFPGDGIKWGDSVFAYSGESAHLTDGILWGEDFDITIIETFDDECILWGDSVSVHVNLSDSLQDGIKWGDIPTPAISISEDLTDGIKWGDIVAGDNSVPAFLQDGVKWGDTLTPIQKIQVSISDGFIWGDQVDGETSDFFPVSVQDKILWGDSISEDVTYPASVSDGIKWGDSISTQTDYHISQTDGIRWGDSAVGSLGGVTLVGVEDGIKWGDYSTVLAAGGVIQDDRLNMDAYMTQLYSMRSSLNSRLTMDPDDIEGRMHIDVRIDNV